MRIHHLNCGTMNPPGGRLINDTGRFLGHAHLVSHCLLIETDHELVLVDTGIGLADIEHPDVSLGPRFLQRTRPRLDPAETALHQVKQLGYAPDDVRHIVLTHCHRDHAGGLADFPQAKVHVHEAEYRAAMAPADQHESARYSPAQWAHGPDWAIHPADGDQWFGFDSVRPLAGISAEILLIPLHGHSRGHAGVAVRTSPTPSESDAQWLLHAGDAYFFHREVDPESPRSTPGLALFQSLMQIDRKARRNNQRRLRELAAAHGPQVEIFSAHDPGEFDRRR